MLLSIFLLLCSSIIIPVFYISIQASMLLLFQHKRKSQKLIKLGEKHTITVFFQDFRFIIYPLFLLPGVSYNATVTYFCKQLSF